MEINLNTKRIIASSKNNSWAIEKQRKVLLNDLQDIKIIYNDYQYIVDLDTSLIKNDNNYIKINIDNNNIIIVVENETFITDDIVEFKRGDEYKRTIYCSTVDKSVAGSYLSYRRARQFIGSNNSKDYVQVATVVHFISFKNIKIESLRAALQNI